MGQEIEVAHFKHYDFQRFERLLRHEQEVLGTWFREGRFSSRPAVAGLELEAWLLDRDGRPAPRNMDLIERLGDPEVVPELAQFNVEFNVPPRPLAAAGIQGLMEDLERRWNGVERAATGIGVTTLSIGILPTVEAADLSLANVSPLHRYQALNEQVLRLRQGRPIRLDIEGRERLRSEHSDVVIESAATSFQLHLQVPFEQAVRAYNAAIAISPVMVAIAANSPFLFGKRLWDETRIPVFEQAVDVGSGAYPRVSFGTGYAVESLLEVFEENVGRHPVMLPLAMDQPCERLAHVRLHNGTIWRWNRPLIGFDEDGTPHLRIEHRVMAAGPSLTDMAANAALFYGLMSEALSAERPWEESRPFYAVREDFYAAARDGLDSEIRWGDGRLRPLRRILQEELLPTAARGLGRIGVERRIANHWLDVLTQRVQTGQTGAGWQRRFVDRHGPDWRRLTFAYRDLQRSGNPVHAWRV